MLLITHYNINMYPKTQFWVHIGVNLGTLVLIRVHFYFIIDSIASPL